ncbi:MAG TPA: hypothetical protein VNS52_07205 [Gemmatimonadaceae bacterium]|nr:hypothetical protein [Gemmatimonadaceae bacterium]
MTKTIPPCRALRKPGVAAVLVLVTLLLLAVPLGAVRAQHAGHDMARTQASSPPSPASAPMSEEGMADHAMSGPMLDMSAHLRMTDPRPAHAADARRAAALVTTLRASLAKYRDVRAAEADGYVMFAPQVKKQPVYHFTKKWSAVKSAFTFDPAAPTSLLYERNAHGDLVLVGAMYTAPKGASPDELDRRVPLSVARWHQHVNVCVPKRGERERWREMEGGRMRFGPAGTIATRAACDAAGGRFLPQLFGWMVHANVFASDDPARIWGEHR